MRFTRPARTIRAAAVAAAAVALVGTSALSASADPDFGTPDADDIVGTGSDTTQGVTNDLAKAYNGGTPAPTRRLASFDAVGSATIEIRPGVVINRPNGSSAGIREVTSNTNVDFARSSRVARPAMPRTCGSCGSPRTTCAGWPTRTSPVSPR